MQFLLDARRPPPAQSTSVGIAVQQQQHSNWIAISSAQLLHSLRVLLLWLNIWNAPGAASAERSRRLLRLFRRLTSGHFLGYFYFLDLPLPRRVRRGLGDRSSGHSPELVHVLQVLVHIAPGASGARDLMPVLAAFGGTLAEVRRLRRRVSVDGLNVVADGVDERLLGVPDALITGGRLERVDRVAYLLGYRVFQAGVGHEDRR